MESFEIPVVPDRRHFEELLNMDEVSYFKSPQILGTLLVLGIVAIISLTLYLIIPHVNLDIIPGLWLISLVVVLITLVMVVYAVYRVNRKRKVTMAWLREVDQMNDVRIKVTDGNFQATIDGEIEAWPWTSFNNVRVSDQRIYLRGDCNIFIPAKSMTPNDYERLKSFVLSKVIDKETYEERSIADHDVNTQ